MILNVARFRTVHVQLTSTLHVRGSMAENDYDQSHRCESESQKGPDYWTWKPSIPAVPLSSNLKLGKVF
jgi:hypothetical protein